MEKPARSPTSDVTKSFVTRLSQFSTKDVGARFAPRGTRVATLGWPTAAALSPLSMLTAVMVGTSVVLTVAARLFLPRALDALRERLPTPWRP